MDPQLSASTSQLVQGSSHAISESQPRADEDIDLTGLDPELWRADVSRYSSVDSGPVITMPVTPPALTLKLHRGEEIDWDMPISHYKELIALSHETFGIKAFRPQQLKAIGAAIRGKDVFVLFPTGAGKSFCFQLAATFQIGDRKGLTVVFTPLQSLLEDQMRYLLGKRVAAICFFGGQEASYHKFCRGRLEDPNHTPSLLYVTPEYFFKSNWLQDNLHRLDSKDRLSRFVVDEAHLISTWGKTFRPDYDRLCSIRDMFPQTPITALTATATKGILADITTGLKLEPDYTFVSTPLNRPNIKYSIREKSTTPDTVLYDMARLILTKYKWVSRRNANSGIIYCRKKAHCEEIAQVLECYFRIRIQCYHHGMPDRLRAEALAAWQVGEIQVIVATVAFGMGINKADVRFVFHHTMPKSLLQLYQESGRAGRDGLPAESVVYYSNADLRWCLTRREDGDSIDNAEANTKLMVKDMEAVREYCTTAGCRRHILLSVFEDERRVDPCGNCDNCLNTRVPETDITGDAIHVIRLIEKVALVNKQRIPVFKAAGVLSGSKSMEIAEFHHLIPQHRLPRRITNEACKSLIHFLVNEKVLEQYSYGPPDRFHWYLQLGPRADAVLEGTYRVMR
ncbi:hypothetical protein BOTBODRAFT_39945 [Botryobasidium botryosum FD-172 SS1]|uniref:ATP-dependent DNA helicase n=1 Tax=Botryobasidium botryosum (strain FD-172 SS1) TaxID=930990 RepID=A0A067LS53_BOTB1|nr:hypothetical protein BOTBODRAFT_39945 [Botryobasidium botryosum FD-172 SS1]